VIAERFAVVSLMTADEARSAVSAINQHMTSARAILADLYERRGWTALGYTSWRECAVAEFGGHERELYRALEAAQVEQNIRPLLTNLSKPVPESHLRPLAAALPEEQPALWSAAHQLAEERDERFTSRHVEATVDAFIEQKTGFVSKFNAGMKSSDSPEWYTPGHIIDRVVAVFDHIDLDPCSHADAQRDLGARHYYTEAEDGLAQPWHGNVYMNPPYGDAIVPWIPRMVDAYTSGEISAAIALLPGRTDTAWFQPLFSYPICFVRGRLKFSNAKFPAPFPSVIVYLGADTRSFRDWFHDIGPIMLPDGS
jgi:DNA N-6-adenine-methyltransferase Dam